MEASAADWSSFNCQPNVCSWITVNLYSRTFSSLFSDNWPYLFRLVLHDCLVLDFWRMSLSWLREVCITAYNFS